MRKDRSSYADNAIWKLIEQSNATDDFDSLIAAGAQSNTLLALLENLKRYSPAEDVFEALTEKGLSRRQAKMELAKVNAAKASLWRLLPPAYAEPLSEAFEQELMKLPNTLAAFASRITEILKRKKFKQPPTWNHLLAMLVVYVHKATKSYHDKHVSSLIVAISDHNGYDETAHKQWRYRNKALLNRVANHAAPRR